MGEHPATVGRGDLTAVDEIDGVDLRTLQPCTTLLVRTVNTVYRVVIDEGPEIYVQGGSFFPELTAAYLDGATIAGSCVKAGWIGIGLRVRIRSKGRSIVTSPVCSITAA